MATEGKVGLPPLAVTAYTAKQPKRTKTEEEKRDLKRKCDQVRNKARVNLGTSYSKWRDLRDRLGISLDSKLAVILLDSYEKATNFTPLVHGISRPPPLTASLSDRDENLCVAGVQELDTSSSKKTDIECGDASHKDNEAINVDEFNDIKNSTIDWDDETCSPEMETESVSSKEEEEIGEADEDSDSSDEADYVPHPRIQSGGALKRSICLDAFPEVSLEDMVHNIADNFQDSSTTDTPKFTEAQVCAEDDIIGHPASITYHGCLKQLAEYLVLPVSHCTAQDPNTNIECGAAKPFKICTKSSGTAAVVEWLCPQGHTVWKWTSQPTLKQGMLAGDFMLACNILLSGNNYTKISLLFKFMKMGMVDRSSFFRIQDDYCVDAIKELWVEKRADVINKIHPKGPVVILGDARRDNPGSFAQYCTYAAMDNDSKQILSLVNVDKSKTQRNSDIMEKVGFMHTLDTLIQELQISEICTDAHPQIIDLFNNGKYKNSKVHHTLDIRYGFDSLVKKVHSAGQQKGCSILKTWTKDICNHFWHCCKTADNYEDFLDIWIGLLHHVTGEHEWALGACHHGSLMESREKQWIKRGSLAHQRLTEIVLDKRWLRNVHKYLRFRSAAELESFHNYILMYANNGFSFSPPVYAARTMLAGLDYNHHVLRPAKRKADGSIMYHKVLNKKCQKWSLYTMKVAKDYSYISDLQRTLLRRKLSATEGMSDH